MNSKKFFFVTMYTCSNHDNIVWHILNAFRYGNIRAAAFERYDYFITAGHIFALCFLSKIYSSYLLGFTRIRDIVFRNFSRRFSASLLFTWLFQCAKGGYECSRATS